MIIKIVTLVLMAAFYICYFAKMISQRKQGIKTDQLGKGKEGFVKFIEVTLKITTYLLPLFQIFSILFYKGTAHFLLRSVGIIITAVGVIVFMISVVQMRDNWRAGSTKRRKNKSCYIRYLFNQSKPGVFRI